MEPEIKIGEIEILEPIEKDSFSRRRYSVSGSRTEDSEYLIILHGVTDEIGRNAEELADFIRLALTTEG